MGLSICAFTKQPSDLLQAGDDAGENKISQQLIAVRRQVHIIRKLVAAGVARDSAGSGAGNGCAT